MRRYLTLACLVLAACDDAIAIEVVVPEGMAADRVQLFIPLDPCNVDANHDGQLDGSCTSMKPDLGTVRKSDEIYFTDSILELPGHGPGTYSFRLEHDARIRVPLLIAIAVDQQGLETGAALFGEIKLSAGPLRERVILDKAEAFEIAGANRGVHVWNTGEAVCIAIERTPSDPVFIVSKEDPDCDGLTTPTGTAPECNPLSYLGFQQTQPGFSCVAHDDDGLCSLGVDACVDGVGRNPCNLTNICLPADACTACIGVIDPQTCIDTLRTSDTIELAHVTCQVRGNVGNGLATCNGTNEANVVANFDLAPFVGMGECERVRFAPKDQPTTLDPALYKDDLTIDIPSAGMGSGGPMTFTVEDHMPRCQFNLRWSPPTPTALTNGQVLISTILLDTVNTTSGKSHQMMIPMQIVISPCTGAGDGTCALEGSTASKDSLKACAD